MEIMYGFSEARYQTNGRGIAHYGDAAVLYSRRMAASKNGRQ